MSTPPLDTAVPPAPQTSTPAMILTLGLVAAVCGLIIVGAYLGSLPAVKENRRIALERAIDKVLPGARTTVAYHALPGGVIARAGGGETPAGALPFYAAYAAGGELIGIAAEGSAKGYADNIRIMFGYSPGCRCIVGIGVVATRETPGIGDRIVTDAAFLANFKALDARLNVELSALANEIKTVKHGSKTQAWQIDAIAGATVTSRAVGRAINDAAQVLLPRLVPKLAEIGKSS